MVSGINTSLIDLYVLGQVCYLQKLSARLKTFLLSDFQVISFITSLLKVQYVRIQTPNKQEAAHHQSDR